MKISTITCHHVYNYGATLQAYALQQAILSLGHESEIINYIPWYHNRYKFWSVNRRSPRYSIIENHFLLKLLWCIKFNLPLLIKEYRRKKSFDRFDLKFLKIGKYKYADINELKLNAPVSDIYVCGSDQIWNTDITEGIEKAYYLNFGPETTKRVAYAASFGRESVETSYRQEIKHLLEQFDDISVRESTGLDILRELGIDHDNLVLDPVLLLDRSQWSKLANMAKQYNLPTKFILLYNFRCDNRIRDIALRVKSEYSWPIVCIHGYDEIDFADFYIRSAGPLEFLSLIRDASLIISDSFHATVFSVIFNKEFYTFSLSGQKNSNRMKNFLEIIEIENRLDVDSIATSQLDYNAIMERLAPYVINSKKFLKSAVNHGIQV